MRNMPFRTDKVVKFDTMSARLASKEEVVIIEQEHGGSFHHLHS